MATAARHTVAGIFREEQTARQVEAELAGAGIPKSNIQIGSQANWTAGVAGGGAGLSGRAPEQHHGGFIGWLESLFGGDASEEERGNYAEAVRRGNCIVTVNTTDENVDTVVDIMERHDAVDIDEEAARYRETGYTGANTAPATADLAGSAQTSTTGNTKSIPVVKEELQVGKRAVQRGGVRVYTRTVEQPVEEQVTLREEKVRVERRPADRPVSSADAGQLRDQTIEVTETVEEPVVSKRARVVEEVVVGKDATERTETVRDTVRNQQVEVERLSPGSSSTAASQSLAGYEQDFRSDFNTNYAKSGLTYDAYAPAYEYGVRTSSDPRYKGRSFEDIEDTIKTDYLRNNPNSSWDRMRGAVRYGWERATGKR